MIEVIASTLILGLVVVGALNTLGSVYKTRALNESRLIAPGMAQELMYEILSTAYTDPDETATGLGIDNGEVTTTRATFDDVDDYDGWDEFGLASKDGTALAGYENYGSQITVSWVNPATLGSSVVETGLKKIDVTIRGPDGQETRLVAFRHQNGALEQSVGVDTTAITWIGAALQLDSATPIARQGVRISNYATDSAGL